MHKKSNELPNRSQRTKDAKLANIDKKAARLPPKSVRIKKTNPGIIKKPNDRTTGSADDNRPERQFKTITQEPQAEEPTDSSSKFQTIDPSPQPVINTPQQNIQESSHSPTPIQNEQKIPATINCMSPEADPVGARRTGFLGHIQEMYGICDDVIRKKMQQKQYMDQLQEQIKEKQQRKMQEKYNVQQSYKNSMDAMQTAKVTGEPWINKRQFSIDTKNQQNENIEKVPIPVGHMSPKIQSSEKYSSGPLPSITGSHRAYVPQKIEVFL